MNQAREGAKPQAGGTTPYGDGYSISDDGAKLRLDPEKCRYLDCQEPTFEWLTWDSAVPGASPVRFPVCARHGVEIKANAK